MGAVSNIVAGVALGAIGCWLVGERRRRVAWVGVACIVAAVCLLASGAIAGLGRPVALNVITAAGLWAIGVRWLLAGTGRFRALAIIAAGAVVAACAVLAVIEWWR